MKQIHKELLADCGWIGDDLPECGGLNIEMLIEKAMKHQKAHCRHLIIQMQKEIASLKDERTYLEQWSNDLLIELQDMNDNNIVSSLRSALSAARYVFSDDSLALQAIDYIEAKFQTGYKQRIIAISKADSISVTGN